MRFRLETKTIARFEASQLRRVNFLFVVIVLFSAIAIGRLFHKAIIEHSYYLNLAKSQRELVREIPANRGEIVVEEEGRDFPLATNITQNTLTVIPNHITEPKKVAKELAVFVGKKPEELEKLFATSKLYIPPLKKRLTDEESEAIKKLDLEGVMLVPEQYRFYPEDRLASTVLGFVDTDKKGQYGVEGYFDKILRGTFGMVKGEKDSSGKSIAVAATSQENPKDGGTVVLTIDRAVQDFVEQKLRAAVERFSAKSGSVIIMDPYTGRIISMASMPDFDPNNYGDIKDYNAFTSQAISSAYEPGSIFKVITMAAALNENTVQPDTTGVFDAYVEVDGQKIYTAIKQAYGKETMTQVLENSDNVAMVWVIQKLTRDPFYRYLRSFGFGVQTGLEMENEASGFVKDKHNLPELDFATTSFGQGIMVTPIQFVTALAAFANGGKLVQPHIIDKIIQQDGREIVTQNKVIREVISPKTAQQIGEMMVSVVENGHGKAARVKGYNVAGKTGTAQVADENGAYSYSKHIGSFGGFAPLENPKFAMLVRLDEPKGVSWAEESAAPLFGEIADFMLKYYQVPPTK